MTDEYEGNWITVYSGGRFHYKNPTVDEIFIEDIAHSLSLKCRFSGHTRVFYSVAEHSMRVAELLPDRLKLVGLLHDAQEAYMPDIPRPIKVEFGLYEYEKIIEDTIRIKFGLLLTADDLAIVKVADNIMLATEARDLMSTVDGWATLPEPLLGIIEPDTNHIRVEDNFLTFFSVYSRNIK